MIVHKSVLEAKVAAINNANRYANLVWHVLYNAFLPLLGQKLLKINGSLTQKIRNMIDDLDLPNTTELCIYRSSRISSNSLAFVVKTCEFYKTKDFHQATYHETYLYIGDMNGQILHSMGVEPPKLKTDYSATEIIQARIEYEKAQKVANELKGKLAPFGEYD